MIRRRFSWSCPSLKLPQWPVRSKCMRAFPHYMGHEITSFGQEFFSPLCPDWLRAEPGSYMIITGILCPQGENWFEHNSDTSLPSSTKINIEWSCTSVLLCFMAWCLSTRTDLFFFFTQSQHMLGLLHDNQKCLLM